MPVGLADRWRGEALAADGLHHLEVAPGLVQPLRSTDIVFNSPLEEADDALDREAEVAGLLAQILERTAGLRVLVKLADPGLDSLVTRLGDDGELLGDRDLLPLDRA